jgi:uncharacterized protein (DUF1330 family)
VQIDRATALDAHLGTSNTHPPNEIITIEGRVQLSLTFYALLWPHPGTADALIAYEDEVLSLVPEHGGTVLHRARSDGADGQPLEIQLFEFPTTEAFDSYMADPRRTMLASDRDHAIARTELINVHLV